MFARPSGISHSHSGKAMSSFDDAKKVTDALVKQGKAIITVTLVAYANDVDFPNDRPSCRVYVTVRDPSDNNKVVSDLSHDIQTNNPPYSCRFEVPVESPIRSLK